MKFQDWKIQIRISSELMRWMRANGHTIETAAPLFKTYPKKLSLLINQQAYPNIENLIAMCTTMGVSADYLLCLGEKNEQDK